MKKKIQLLIILMILLLAGKFLIVNKSQNLQLELDEDNAISILLTANYKQQRIYPWYSESNDRYYFFLPAYCQSEFLRLNKIKGNKIISLNGMDVQSNRKFILEKEKTYQLEILTENANVDYDIIFLQSENLPAVFIGTDSGSMEYIHQDKENEEPGNIESRRKC